MEQEQKIKLYQFIERMPKVELHVHLEGSIKPEVLLMLAQRNNITLPAQNVDALKNFFKFKDFAHFYQVYQLVTSCLKTVDDYELIAYQFGSECARQNIRYAEVTFSIFANCQQTGLSWKEILDALNRGKMQAHKKFGVDWGWIFDIIRDQADSLYFILDTVLQSKNKNVVALGLTGNEDVINTDVFSRTFERARSSHCPSTIHTGETGSAENMWRVLNLLHPDRIGHGVACAKDQGLIDFLKRQQIPLELCPTSNICIGLFPNFKEHPLRRLWDAGLYITINSDDPALFNTDLNNEYKILVDYFNFTIDELEKVTLNAVHASFLNDEVKQSLDHEFRKEFIGLRKEFGFNPV